jgi:DNA-binding transcriptional LysR family regulator
MEFNLHRLRLLRELSYRGTISAVATATSYSPATISQQLAQLQKEVGAPLLEPDGRRLRLSSQAQLLVRHTEVVLDRLERAEADIARSLNEVGGTVRMAVFQTAMLTLVPRALTLLRERHPALRIEITQAEPETARSALLPRDYDLVIDEIYPGYPQPHSEVLDQQLLTEDMIRLADTDAIVHKTKLSEYQDAAWVMELQGSPAREWTLAICRTAGFEPDIRYETADMVVQTRLIEAGHAVAFLPDLMGMDRPTRIRLHHLAPTHRRRIVTTCRSSTRDHPAIQAVRSALQEAISETTAL